MDKWLDKRIVLFIDGWKIDKRQIVTDRSIKKEIEILINRKTYLYRYRQLDINKYLDNREKFYEA